MEDHDETAGADGEPARLSVVGHIAEAGSYVLGMVDAAYGAAAAAILPTHCRFFPLGFGDLGPCLRLLDLVGRQRADSFGPAEVRLAGTARANGAVRATHGEFLSPLAAFLPPESRTAHVLVVEPPAGKPVRGVVVHLAATGDEGFSMRRRLVADPLARRGYASVLLIIPMYGRRRPDGQHRYYARTVADMLAASAGCMVEGARLVAWARRHWPGVPVGLTGVSYGGAMASGAALLDLEPAPLALCSCVGSPSPRVLTMGVLRDQVDWAALRYEEDQLNEIFEHVSIFSWKHAEWRADACPDKRISAVSVYARHDKIVVPSEAIRLGETLRGFANAGRFHEHGIPGGHVSSIGFGRAFFVEPIVQSFELLEREVAAA